MKTHETKLCKVLGKTSGRSMLYVMTKKYDNIMSNFVCYYTQNTKHSAPAQVFLFLHCSYMCKNNP